MQDLLYVLGLALLGWVLVGPAVALAYAKLARREMLAMQKEIRRLQAEVRDLGGEAAAGGGGSGPPAPAPRKTAEPPAAAPVRIPDPPASPAAPAVSPVAVEAGRAAGKRPSGADLESEFELFLGGKLVAWLGGLALFLGVVFFVKYAFDQNLISPVLRVATGFASGAGLVIAGILLRHRQRYAVLTRTLIATGILISYGSAYAANALYQLPGFTQTGTFACMGGITAAAFALAVRLRAPVVAVLGMAGGFLTPWLLHTGEDRLIELFGYVLLLDLGLVAVDSSLRRAYLLPCAAGGTLLTQIAWFAAHFRKSGYADGDNIALVAAVFLLFPLLFAAVSAGRRGRSAQGMPRWLLLAGPCSLITLGGVVSHIFLGLPALRDPPHLAMGMGAALAGILLALQEIHRTPNAGAFATVGLASLAFHAGALGPGSLYPAELLAWCVASAALLGLYPFLRRSDWQPPTIWATAAMSYLLFFPAVYRLVERAWPNDWMGAIPVAFALPVLASLAASPTRSRGDAALRESNRLWYGGAAIFFIAVAVPAQLSDRWLTLGWALQGAALCRLSWKAAGHWGLRLSGFGLLAAAFVRLAVQPFAESYERAGPPVWNWMLYTYLLAALCMAAGARWLPPPGDRLGNTNIRAILQIFCGVLLFLLMQIQVANAFAEPGERYVALALEGEFAFSMTCSIAWALYALALLIAGFVWSIRGARYAGLALFGVTLTKLFVHDLANIESFYRIAAFVGVAVLALGAAFLYQKFSVVRDGGTSGPAD